MESKETEPREGGFDQGLKKAILESSSRLTSDDPEELVPIIKEVVSAELASTLLKSFLRYRMVVERIATGVGAIEGAGVALMLANADFIALSRGSLDGRDPLLLLSAAGLFALLATRLSATVEFWEGIESNLRLDEASTITKLAATLDDVPKEKIEEATKKLASLISIDDAIDQVNMELPWYAQIKMGHVNLGTIPTKPIKHLATAHAAMIRMSMYTGFSVFLFLVAVCAAMLLVAL